MKIVIGLSSAVGAFSVKARHIERLRAGFPGADVVSTVDEDGLAAALPGASVYWGWTLPPELLDAAPSLRWVATPAAGLDWIMSDRLAASGITVTNSHFHGKIMAESVLGMLLHFTRQLGRCRALQETVAWCRSEIEPGLSTLRGKTVSVIGFGPLGGHTARLLDAFGVRVIGVNRSLRNDTGVSVEMRSINDLHAVLGESDHVVLTLPGTPETEGLFSDREFAVMRPGACLVNVGRGSCIDEEALLRALDSGRLLGAALDVFAVEPLPMESPLRRHPDVLVTPHASAISGEYMDLALEEFLENLRRFAEGAPLVNVVGGGECG